MKINENIIRRLIRQVLLENTEAYDDVYTLKFSQATVKIGVKGKNYFVISWPEPIEGQEVSESSPLAFEKLSDVYEDSLVAEVQKGIDVEEGKKRERKAAEAPLKKYKYDPNAGYPLFLINNINSKPISQNLMKKYDAVSKKGANEIFPEGHAYIVYVDPRTRAVRRVDFGVFNTKEGGHPECQTVNDESMASKAFASVFNQVGFMAMGSVVVRNFAPVPEKALKKVGDNFIIDSAEEQAALERAGVSVSEDDVTRIDGCKYLTKVTAIAQSTTCHEYNVVPLSLAASTASMFSRFFDTVSGTSKASAIPSKSGDSCASFSFKMAYYAKYGKYPPDSLTKQHQYPGSLVARAEKTLGGR